MIYLLKTIIDMYAKNCLWCFNLFCIVLQACPLGSYCPLATLNKTTGICEPWVLILASSFVLLFLKVLLACCVIELIGGYTSVVDIFISYLQCSQIIVVEEQIFGLMLVVVVKCFAQQDPIVQQPPKEFLALVGIILLQCLFTLYKILNLDPRSKSFAISS